MAGFRRLCEELRNAVDDQGAKGCFKQSLDKFAQESGLATDGLWAAVDGVLQGFDTTKLVRKLVKSYGGEPEIWERWVQIAQARPDCPKAVEL